VDLAGLSLLPVHLNLGTSLEMETSEISLNNNLYLALITEEMPDVMEVLNIMVCNIILITESVLKPLTHIPPVVVQLLHANNHLAQCPLSPTKAMH